MKIYTLIVKAKRKCCKPEIPVNSPINTTLPNGREICVDAGTYYGTYIHFNIEIITQEKEAYICDNKYVFVSDCDGRYNKYEIDEMKDYPNFHYAYNLKAIHYSRESFNFLTKEDAEKAIGNLMNANPDATFDYREFSI